MGKEKKVLIGIGVIFSFLAVCVGLIFGFLALCVREIIKRAFGLGRWVEDRLLTPPSLQIRGNIQAKKAKIQKARRSRHGKGEE